VVGAVPGVQGLLLQLHSEFQDLKYHQEREGLRLPGRSRYLPLAPTAHVKSYRPAADLSAPDDGKVLDTSK
jgi:hypothetical protein